MITIIHGDDLATSRKFYIEERQKIKDPMIFYGETLNLTDLAQALQSNSLFEIEKKAVFIEGLFLKKSTKELETITNFLEKNKDSNIYIYESKELSKKQLGLFKHLNSQIFSLPKSLFLFLDEIKPKNGKRAMDLFHTTLQNTSVELVFYMMIRQFRLLLAITSNIENNIDEAKYLSPWQKSKLQKQVILFTKDDLKNIYKKICSIEVSQKTGADILSLPQVIDFFLLSI